MLDPEPEHGVRGVERSSVDESHRLRATWSLPPDHPILRGHFPNAPLVPGVLLLDAVRAACERAFARPFVIHEVADVRFSRPLMPGDEAVLDAVASSDDDGSIAVAGEWVTGETAGDTAGSRVATFRLRLRAPPPS